MVIVDFERIDVSARVDPRPRARGQGGGARRIEAAGFRFVEEVTIPGFHENYFLRFERP
ncbi:MAG: hypothetical protein R3F17_10065 [Planctomycetota bacterium]